MRPAEVLASRRHVLLDFDGPVCAVFGGEMSDRAVADELKTMLGSDLPADVATARDPFDVLRYASSIDLPTAKAIEVRFRELEVAAISSAPATPGADTTIRSLVASGRTVTVVSNNSSAAVHAYLEARGLAHLVRHVSARTDADQTKLKPRPYLLLQAVRATDTQLNDCVMVGDSATDIEAAHAAKTAVIAYANKPGKREQFLDLHPDAIAGHMSELTAGS